MLIKAIRNYKRLHATVYVTHTHTRTHTGRQTRVKLYKRRTNERTGGQRDAINTQNLVCLLSGKSLKLLPLDFTF